MTPFGDAKNPARGLYDGLSGGLARVTAQAVTPEQLLPYVGAVSGLRPRLFGDCVGHTGEGEVVLMGYPLHDPRDTAAVDAAVREALTLPRLSRITVLAAARPAAAPPGAESREDAYWSLPLPVPPVGQKLQNMLRRAARDITVEQSGGPDCWTAEHAALVEDFCRAHALEPGSVHIFRHLDAYLAAAPQARLFSARRRARRTRCWRSWRPKRRRAGTACSIWVWAFIRAWPFSRKNGGQAFFCPVWKPAGPCGRQKKAGWRGCWDADYGGACHDRE